MYTQWSLDGPAMFAQGEAEAEGTAPSQNSKSAAAQHKASDLSPHSSPGEATPVVSGPFDWRLRAHPTDPCLSTVPDILPSVLWSVGLGEYVPSTCNHRCFLLYPVSHLPSLIPERSKARPAGASGEPADAARVVKEDEKGGVHLASEAPAASKAGQRVRMEGLKDILVRGWHTIYSGSAFYTQAYAYRCARLHTSIT